VRDFSLTLPLQCFGSSDSWGFVTRSPAATHHAAANHSKRTGRRSVHFPPPAPEFAVYLLWTIDPTASYILQCGIHRIAGIYSAAPSASRCVGRRGFAPDTRGFAQESREG
jgi:hypothetical protein